MADPKNIVGLASLERKLRRLGPESTQVAKREIAAGALILQNAIRTAIASGSKSGRIYTRGGVQHQASAPGEAPATDTGRLLGSINVETSPDGLSASIGVTELTNVPYARRLEFGGMDSRGVFIAERPYIRPAWRENIKNIRNSIREALDKSIKAEARK